MSGNEVVKKEAGEIQEWDQSNLVKPIFKSVELPHWKAIKLGRKSDLIKNPNIVAESEKGYQIELKDGKVFWIGKVLLRVVV